MGEGRNWKCDDPVHRAGYAAVTAEALRCIEGKWKILILCQLFALGTLRFSELERLVKGVTQKMLTQQLKELEKDGLVRRDVYPQVPPKVEYSLTDVGRALGPPIASLMEWAEARREQQGGLASATE
ncbi:winged helix-turn-helix transcriptional regulator [Microvirga terricola]|uniref:Winged helix-turn-helix transcriptional regulator n=1 Tax=Microvirga terricola TaxID=2719797 RepID=A0ABX0VG95_9HYPH|nr:helix-turn-helix domain-containing protein [Microvirga terricola]NIX77461.1 winged helix-turn-helix transcriptional regulator [Microvirga terricola]